jgi:hypothetical protein
MKNCTTPGFLLRLIYFLNKDLQEKDDYAGKKVLDKEVPSTARVIYLYEREMPVSNPAKVVPMFP